MNLPSNSGDKVYADPFLDASTSGSLFARLEAVRLKHYTVTHNSALATAYTGDTSVAVGNQVKVSTPALIKTYLKNLENSRYITGTPSNNLSDAKIGDLLEIEKYKLIDSTIKTVEDACLYNRGNYASYSTDATNYSNFVSDFSNFSSHSGDTSNFSGHSAQATFYSGHGSYADSSFCNPYSGCH